MTRRAAAAIAFLIGCSSPRSSDPEDEVVLRVSAVAGLSELIPGLEISGSSTTAMELVFDELDQHIESMHAEGASVVLLRRATARPAASELAASLRGKELRSARALDENRIEARFDDAETATLVAQYGALGFDLGPFQIDQQDERYVRLVRRGNGAIDVIELLEATRSDEWRKLLAHELDVVPWAASLYRTEFAGMASIRIFDIHANDTATLYFNVRAPQLAHAAVRRRIAAAIHREAMARLICGTSACASPSVDASSTSSVPPRLSILVPEDDTDLRTAAKILRHQLWSLGLELTIQPIAVPDIVRRMTSGESELVLLPLTLADHRFGFFLSPGHPKGLPMTGFASPEYDAAVDRGDLATAQAVLDRELPATRLFELRSFAAVDAGLCGDVKPSSGSWLWLSELYLCAEGPAP